MASFFEFPIFTGVSGELRPWISWLEDFFVRENFTAMEKMNLAQSLLEGEAEAWFYRIQKTLIFYSWKELKDKLLLRFGDFADSDRIRLIVELDRFLQEIRDEARIQRMKTTSIPVKDTITVVEETSEIVAGNLAERASEKKLVSQYQVPVSSLEPSLSFSSEPLDVSASWLCEVVSNNLVHSQSVLDCVKNKTNAYQVFDKTSSHKERLKPKTKRKLGLSLKTWMFKFKHTSNKRKSLDVKSFSVEEIAWLMRDSKEIYRSCVDKEFKAVVAGSKGLASDGCVILGMHCAGFGSGKTELLATGQQMQRTDLFSELLKDSSNGRAESFPILTVVTEHSFLWLQKPSENYLLVSAFEKRKQVLGYKTRMFKYKSRFQEISLTDTQFLCEKVQRVSCLSLAAQFNSLEIIQAVLEQIIQGETSTKIIDNAASSSGSHAKSLLIAMGFCPTLVQKAIGENGEDLELLLEILTKSTVTEEPSFRGLMEPKPEPDIESATDIRRMTLLTIQCPENLVDLALDRLGKGMPHWERMSIWHRWRRKDCTRPSSCVLPLLFSFFKLEDKLVLRGESIDTILHRIQSFYRKKKQVVTWQSSS